MSQRTINFFIEPKLDKEKIIEQIQLGVQKKIDRPVVPEKTKTKLKKKKRELFVESIRLPYSKELSKICHTCKNLYNLGNYYVNKYIKKSIPKSN